MFGTVCVGLERLHQRPLKPSELGESVFLLNLGAWSPEALSHFLTVLPDSPVRLAISLLESCSHNFMRLILPILYLVITFLRYC